MISRISKDIVTLEQKLSINFKESSIYFISYLKQLLIRSIQNETNGKHNSLTFYLAANLRMKQDGPQTEDQIAEKVGPNDKYLITKLNQNKITLEKIDRYLLKL